MEPVRRDPGGQFDPGDFAGHEGKRKQRDEQDLPDSSFLLLVASKTY